MYWKNKKNNKQTIPHNKKLKKIVRKINKMIEEHYVLKQGGYKMNWIDVRKSYPNKWVVLEGLKTRTHGNQKYYDNISVMDFFDDGNLALKSCNSLHKEYPKRDFHFIHTSHEKLEIPLKQWLGIRR